MKNISFNHIHIEGHIVYEDELYKQFHHPELLKRYDSNFVEYKKMPSFYELFEAIVFLRVNHLCKGMKHVKFTFPENEKLTTELLDYLTEELYSIGFLELYAIEPSRFPVLEKNPDIEVQVVTAENFEVFLDLQYQQDLQYGSEYADQKIGLYKRGLQNPKVVQILGLYKGISAGSVVVHLTDETAEIDELVVEESYQKRGIGSRLQQYVMTLFPEKTIILVADGEDTPRDMYQKQGYQYLGYKYYVQKVWE